MMLVHLALLHTDAESFLLFNAPIMLLIIPIKISLHVSGG